jgi:adenylate cyclase
MSKTTTTTEKKEGLRFTIGFKLVSIISLIIVVSLLGMILVANVWFRDSIRKQIQVNNLDLVFKTSLKIEDDFNAIVEKAGLVASAIQGEIGSSKDRDSFKYLLFSRDKDFVFVGIAVRESKDGIKIRDKAVNDQFLAENGLDSDVIQKAITEDAGYFDRSFSFQNEVHNATPYFGVPVIGISVPFSKRNQTAADAILIIYVKADRFLNLVQSGSGSINKSFFVNNEGEVLAHHDSSILKEKSNLTSIPIVGIMMKSANPNGQTTFLYEKKNYLGSFNRIMFADIGVVSMVDEKAAFSDADRIRQRNLYIAVIVLSIAILIVYFFSKTITNPVTRLVGATGEIENGNFIVNITPTTSDEIGLLTNSFVRMGKGLSERERMKEAFGKFVNKEIAEQILKGEIKLGGERKTAAIFFSDIRSFTSISEALQPEEVVEFLNEYMTRMVACVNDTKGNVDKFIGDAIMAVWGTPVSYGNDTENAVNGALCMRASLIDFNKGRGGPRKPVIKIGCGINTGPVLAGQIGSHDRMEYTVIGDTVNLASRIESLNKPFGTDILISEDSYAIVKDLYYVEPMQKIKVKGKKDPQQIYAVLSRRDDPGGIRTIGALRSILGINDKDLTKYDPDKEEIKYEIIE